MIVTLYGGDSYRRTKKLKELADAYRAKRDVFAYEIFDLEEEGELARFFEFIRTPSLFAPVKFAAVKNISAVSKTKELKKILQAITGDPNNMVIVSVPTIHREFNFLLKKPCEAQLFEPLAGEGLVYFLKKEAEARNIKFEPDVLRFLADTFQGDSWAAVTELDKLSLLPPARHEPLTVSGLKELGLRTTHDFFGLMRGWFGKPVRERLLNLERLYLEREDMDKLFNILAYSDPARLRSFADYDIAVKSGKLERDEALLALTLQ